MTNKAEALRLAALLDINHHEPHVEQAAAAELRRQHAEIEQLKSQFEPTIEDNSQDWTRCDPAVAFHLIDRHAENWADAGKMMTEFADAKAEVKLKTLSDELTTQTNRAAAAAQQVTALTQRLDTANALNTEARNELAELTTRNAWLEEELKSQCDLHGKASEREAARMTQNQRMHERIAELEAQLSARPAAPLCYLHVAATIIPRSGYQVCAPADAGAFPVYAAAPPPPEREPLTDEQIDALWGGEKVSLPQRINRRAISRSIERAHGIGATNAR